MPAKQIAIYGAGGFGREVAWLVQHCSEAGTRYETACFIDDDESMHGSALNGIPVVGLAEARDRFTGARVVGGVGSPQVRQQLIEKATEAGFAFETIIHPNVERSPWIEMGVGTVICAGNILTVNIILGQHVQINLDCTIGHDVVMGDFVTLAPGVHISGFVHLGRRVYVGTGAVILGGTQGAPMIVGADSVIGAGACVTKPVPSGQVVVGIPARPLRQAE